MTASASEPIGSPKTTMPPAMERQGRGRREGDDHGDGLADLQSPPEGEERAEPAEDAVRVQG